MKILFVSTLLPCLAACSGIEFAGSKGDAAETRSPEAARGDTGGTPDEEDDTADEPVMVSGSFLTLGCVAVQPGSVAGLDGMTSAFGCGLFSADNQLFAGAVTNVSCINSADGGLKVIEQPEDSSWHFLLAFSKAQQDLLSATSCRMNAGVEVILFPKVTAVPQERFTARKAFELNFDQGPCNSAVVNSLITSAPDVVDADCTIPGRTSGRALKMNGSSTSLTLPLSERLADFFKGDYTITFQFRTPPRLTSSSEIHMTLIGQTDDDEDENDIALALRFCRSGPCAGILTARSGEAGNIDTEATDVPMSPDTWYHIAVRKEDSTLALFLNGVSQGEDTLEKKDVAAGSALLLGRSGTRGEFTAGTLDEFVMWSGALSEANIRDLMKSTATSLPQ